MSLSRRESRPPRKGPRNFLCGAKGVRARCTIRSPNGPVSAGGASTALLLLLLEGGAFARGLPAILLAHGSLLSAGRVGAVLGTSVDHRPPVPRGGPGPRT